MIMVTKPSKPLDMTAKGTPRRQLCLDIYAEEIEELYAVVQESSQTEIAPPSAWTRKETLLFMRACIRKVLNVDIGDKDDIFQQGCDRLVTFTML
jgi:hypothetical protein